MTINITQIANVTCGFDHSQASSPVAHDYAYNVSDYVFMTGRPAYEGEQSRADLATRLQAAEARVRELEEAQKTKPVVKQIVQEQPKGIIYAVMEMLFGQPAKQLDPTKQLLRLEAPEYAKAKQV